MLEGLVPNAEVTNSCWTLPIHFAMRGMVGALRMQSKSVARKTILPMERAFPRADREAMVEMFIDCRPRN